MGKTIAQKIFESHLVDTPFPGTYVLKLDRVFCHEITTPVAINDLVERGKDRVFDPTKIKAVIDHVTPSKDSKTVRKKIGIVYQNNVLDDLLTVQENLITRGVIHGMNKSEASEKLTELSSVFSIGELLKKKYRTLSGGQKRRCEIAAALMHTPEILILDEPTTGLDPAAREEVWDMVTSLQAKAGMTVFLTTHYMEEASKADHIIIINKGKIIAEGLPHELKETYASDKLKLYCVCQPRSA